MGSEKVFAFGQAWAAMWTRWYQVQFSFWRAFTRAVTARSVFSKRGAAFTLSQLAASVLSAGLAPIRAKAVSNAKRLSRARK
jgi:hypothetical protein